MSRRRAYSPDTMGVMERFFLALDKSLEEGRLKNMSQFCEKYKIDKRHLYTQRKDLSRGYFEVAWVVPLVRDCSVSPRWLLTGEGGMYE